MNDNTSRQGTAYSRMKTSTKEWAKANLLPNAVQTYMSYHEAVKDKELMKAHPEIKKEERRKLLKGLGMDGLRVVASTAIYQVTAASYGVSSQDTKLSFSAKEAWGNASSLAMSIAGMAAHLIPQNWKEPVASIIIPLELTISAIRIYVEQQLWKKIKMTPDGAGTLLTPYVAGVLEFAYKAITHYPTDAESRIMVGLTGIYGNMVRLFNAGMMYGLSRVGLKDKSGPGISNAAD